MSAEFRNRLTIEGVGADAFGTRLKGPNGLIDFETISPIPSILKQADEAKDAPSTAASLAAQALAQTGHADTQSFCEATWGGKYNAFEPTIVWAEPERLIARFLTFGGVPLNWTDELARQNPTLRIRIEHWEDMSELTEMTEYAGGKQVYTENLDIAWYADGLDSRQYLRGWWRNGVRMPGEHPELGVVEDMAFLPRMWDFDEHAKWIEGCEREIEALVEQSRLAG